MSISPLKKIWDAGGVAVGTYIMYSRDIATIEIAAAAGLDFVLFDLEHRPHDTETIHDLSQVARLSGMASLVGSREISQHAISHVLDLGASGVVVPHVETPEQVALAIEAVRHAPKGKRARCGVAGHDLYSGRPITEEMDHYNSDIALLLKIESEAAFRRIDKLVDPDEVDGLMVGPVDLSIDLGIPGQTGHKRALGLIERARAACRERKIQFGEIVSSPDEIPEAIKRGAGWIIIGSEMEILADFWRRAVQAEKNS